MSVRTTKSWFSIDTCCKFTPFTIILACKNDILMLCSVSIVNDMLTSQEK